MLVVSKILIAGHDLVFASFDEDHVRECELNCAMMKRVADAVNIIAPSLKTFVYSGGTRVWLTYPSISRKKC
jgi:hypothetical protein